MVSLLLTLFNIASALLILSLSFSVVASCGGGLLVISTVIERCPSIGCNGPTTGGPPVGFLCGDVGGNINDDEFEEIFCPLSDSEPSPVSRTS